MTGSDSEKFLEPIPPLSPREVEEACEVALANAKDLLAEAELLYEHEMCARAFLLAHIACEEVGKLPVLIYAAVGERIGHEVDWKRIDRVLRSHSAKMKQVLFMDSLRHAPGDIRAQEESYRDDLERLPVYNDFKNASLYSFYADGRFWRPSEAVPCQFLESFLATAQARVKAFEGMFLQMIREVGGLEAMFNSSTWALAREAVERMTGEEGLAAMDEYQKTGDAKRLQAEFERLTGIAPPSSLR